MSVETCGVDEPDPDCPPWCQGGHSETAVAGSATHMRSAGVLPVIIEGRPGEPEWAEFDVVRFSREARSEEWVFIGGDGTGWSVSTESACRIYRGLGAVLRVP